MSSLPTAVYPRGFSCGQHDKFDFLTDSMDRAFLCIKISEGVNGLSDPKWEKSRILNIDQYPWKNEQHPYTPDVQVRLLHRGHTLYVRFDCWESEIRATYVTPNDPVCRDSCVEFFFMPDVLDNRYLSFEVNPLGTMLIGIGTGGNDIKYLSDDRAQFHIKTHMESGFWQVCYEIPEAFLRKYYGELTTQLRGNFMKCADRSSTPHHGCWNRIETSYPMFHVPEFFGTILLQEH